MNLENITAENIENGNLTAEQLMDLINGGVNVDVVFKSLNDIFINYTNDLALLDEKRTNIISRMKTVYSIKGKYKPKKQQNKPKKQAKKPKKVINTNDLPPIQISI